MNAAAKRLDYQLTIIDTEFLTRRLFREISSLKADIVQTVPEFRKSPISFIGTVISVIVRRLVSFMQRPNLLSSLITAVLLISSIVLVVLLVERRSTLSAKQVTTEETAPVVIMDLSARDSLSNNSGVGANGTGRVGFRTGKGEGSGAERKRSTGGGSGGAEDPLPPQLGKLPPPSNILASIPKAPPLTPPALPVAGIDVDPALWTDLKHPVYGDPRSQSTAVSNGPGKGGGIGTNEGLGIGDGRGPGYGNGEKGNMGDGERQIGCCGSSGSRYDSNSNEKPRVLRNVEVEQKARLLSKPEPQYSEEARRNQVTGTVTLRVVFSSIGEVVQIHAIQSLPFGLTERAIAAAKQIKFIPATKDGHPVSVYMQLEYNFNLY